MERERGGGGGKGSRASEDKCLRKQTSLSNKLAITDLDLKEERVLIRVEFHVPIQEGKITNPARIDAALPTIKYAIGNGKPALLPIKDTRLIDTHQALPRSFSCPTSAAPMAR